jgi:hypothetical protein
MEVLLLRPNVENEHQREPKSEINHRAREIAAVRQIALLELGKRFLRHLWVEPLAVKVLHAEKRNRNKEKGNERERARGGFQRAPDNDAPVTCR